jgi:hypothetical protein
MKKILISITLLLFSTYSHSKVNHYISTHVSGVTFYDKYGFKIDFIRPPDIPSTNYLLQYKKVGFEIFYDRLYFPTYFKSTYPENTLLYRTREDIGLCFHYYLLKSKISYISIFSGLTLKASNDHIFLFRNITSGGFIEEHHESNNEIGVGIANGANLKCFLHKRFYINCTLRQMNLIDNSKFQRNTMVTEVGIGVRLGKLK